MGRLLTGLIAVAVLWFAYDQWMNKTLAAELLPGASAVALEGSRRVQSEVTPSKRVLAPRPQPAGSSEKPPVRLSSEVDRLIAGIKRKDASALQKAFAVLLRQTGEARARLAGALRAAAESSPSAAGLVPLFGLNNAFLQCPEGRGLIAFAIDRLATEDDATASLAVGTALLKVCMRGPIAKDAVAARASVDAVEAAMEIPLRAITLNPANRAHARSYEVKPGDALSVIASRFRKQGYILEAGTLQLVNRIANPRLLRVGQVIKIPVDPVRTVIDKSSFLMAVYIGKTIVRLYWIGHGKEDRTPDATFKIGAKIKHPDWFAPDGRQIPYGHPDNLLGDYFIKFEHAAHSGFGAHGTQEPGSICDTRSLGCIRMLDADIEEFFRIVPRGSEVEIQTGR